METPEIAARLAAARRAMAEERAGDLVFLNLAADAAALPVGDRLAISHFALSGSVSPLAIGWRQAAMAAPWNRA